MGIGDQIIATGLARGAAARGKKIAFGDGKMIRWDQNSAMIFKNNPNIARPGESSSNVEWINYYKGNRIYNKADSDRWIWNFKFKVKPGEIFFNGEDAFYERDQNLILIEPNVPKKSCAPNKQWPLANWKRVAELLTAQGWTVRQFNYGANNIVCAPITTKTFRDAAALIKSARLVIVPEGGLHHAAAAVGTPAVVLFGGFTPPDVLGYEDHANLTGGATACGKFNRCQHCVDAMAAIKVDDVLEAAGKLCR